MSLSEQDREALYADEIALDNLHSEWGRDYLEAVVAEIAARHVREALTEAAQKVAAWEQMHEQAANNGGPQMQRNQAMRDAYGRAAHIVRNRALT